MKKQAILSICIPTYNGASSFLELVLNSIYEGIHDRQDVEVIVSDNCSNDSTMFLLEKYKVHPNYRYYQNKENIGFNKNMLLLADKYANGKYCWIIGDDDVIEPTFIDLLINQLYINEYGYISLQHKFVTSDSVKNEIGNNQQYSFISSSFEELIDRNCLRGNTLATFISDSVFLTEEFRRIPKGHVENKFDTYYNVFPNATFLVEAFSKAKCAYVMTPAVYAIVHPKFYEDSDKYYNIDVKYIVDLLKHFEEHGVLKKRIPVTYKRVLFDIILSSNKRLIAGKHVDPIFYKALFCALRYPSVYIAVMRSFVNKIIRSIKDR